LPFTQFSKRVNRDIVDLPSRYRQGEICLVVSPCYLLVWLRGGCAFRRAVSRNGFDVDFFPPNVREKFGSFVRMISCDFQKPTNAVSIFSTPRHIQKIEREC